MDKPIIGHYFSKFLEEFEGVSKNRPLSQERKKPFNESIAILHELQENGSHWVLSSDAFEFVWQTDIHSADFEDVKLPYQVMIVEYRFDYARLGYDTATIGEGRSQSPERFFVLIENEDGEGISLVSGFKLDPDIALDDILLPELRWVMSPVAINIKYKFIERLNEWLKPVSGGFDVDMDEKYISLIPALPIFAMIGFQDFPVDKRKEMLTDLFDEVRIALSLLAILSCNNAPVTEIAAPEKLNKKRMKAGKSRIPLYRTLHITSHESRQRHGDGTHASPRTHWRRGHIRNQPTAKGIVRKWIRPTIINAGDVVPAKP